MRSAKKFVATCVLALACVCGMFGDDRTENIDVFVVLDKSLSMVEEIDAVREYVQNSIIDEIVIPGDRLVIITFYGKAETLYAGTVGSAADRVIDMVASIQADGRFTDIGNALDTLKQALAHRTNTDRRTYLLLITDGKQEAPPGSKYYSTEVAFNHEFLENAKEIRMEGWKVHILGVGTESAAEEIADQLSATYTEVSEEPTEEEIEEQTKELLGMIKIDGDIDVRPIGADGSSALVFELESMGYETRQRIVVDEVTLELSDGEELSVLPGEEVIEVPPEAKQRVKLPLSVDRELEAGSYEALLTFSFDGTGSFTPGSKRVELRVRSFVGNNWWLIPVAVLVLAAIGFLVVQLVKRSGSIRFVCEIEDGPARKRAYKLKYGDTLYVIDGVMGLNILPHAGQTPAAEISADVEGLHLSVSDSKQFSAGSIPSNVLGESISVRKKSGKKAVITFEEA